MLNSQSKILEFNQQSLSSRISLLKRPIVFTNGCFDIIHRGHVDYLETSRNLGNSLIVGVNSDSSVRMQNKGKDRPINSQNDRLAIIASLECVDAVVLFVEETPLELIRAVKPDILVKGGDWPVEKIVGAEDVINSGGEVHSIEFQFNRSTSQLIEKIRS